MTQQVPIAELQLDTRCQARSELDADAVAEYAGEYAAGRDLPPVDVYDIGGVLYIVDGFHRFAAAVQADLSFLRVEVVGSGDLDAAVWHATGVNQAHGVRRSNADKRRAVTMAVQSPIGQEQSSRAIAEHCGVGDRLVRELRSAWEADSAGTEPPARRRGRDGKAYAPDQVRLGRTCPPNPAESLEPEKGRTCESGEFPHDEFTAPMPGYGAELGYFDDAIGALRGDVGRRLKHPALSSVSQRIREHLASAAAAAKHAIPVECKRCGGSGCERCGRKGWLEAGQVGR